MEGSLSASERFLHEQCDHLVGQEVSDDLKGLKIENRLDVIRQDLLDLHWREGGWEEANLHGAHLLLHTLIEMETHPDNIFLSSLVPGAEQPHDYCAQY